jgi:hypothetical protein
MKKVLFIDHAFHKKTRSSDFFIDVVRQGFEVQIYYLEPNGRPDISVLKAAADVDYVLLWQKDFLAPVFVAMGKPTIVIPMFDGSGGMAPLHWLFAGRARFFNFSLRLNETIRMLGGKTQLLRFFPPAVPESALPRFDRLSAFFWQRRPDHGITFDYLHKLLGEELDEFHVHNAPDIAGTFRFALPADASYTLSESNWFKNKGEYKALLARANVFIAPRVSEGIGMALLEAMAQGMLVLAHDAPTNNEYISSWLNGILFNKDVKPSQIRIRSSAAQMGRMAWQTVVDGHQQWLDSHSDILDWIECTTAHAAVDIDLELFFVDLWHSYYASPSQYELFLRRHLGLLAHFCDLPFAKVLDLIGDRTPLAESAFTKIRDCALTGDGVMDLACEDDRFIGSGWSAAEPEWRWAEGTLAVLHFSGLVGEARRYKGWFVASALPDLGKAVHCVIALNNVIVFDGRVTPGWKEYEFNFASKILLAENELRLTFDKALSTPTDSRKLSVCFKNFVFAPVS